MKLIVVSTPKNFTTEPQQVTMMFDRGLEIFHLRKPRFSKQNMIEYLSLIPERYHNRIVIHSKHLLALKFNLRGIHLTSAHRKQKIRTWFRIQRLKIKLPEIKITASFHSLEKLLEEKRVFDYVFLSPVFDSISKAKHQGKFRGQNLEVILNKLPQDVIALGGVDIDRIDEIIDMGFAGMAVLGAIWESDKSLDRFIKIYEACKQKNRSLA